MAEEKETEQTSAEHGAEAEELEPDYIEVAEENVGLLPGFGFFIGVLIGLYALWFILANNEPVQVCLFPLAPEVRTTVPVVVVVTGAVVLAVAGVISWRRRRRAAKRTGEADEQ